MSCGSSAGGSERFRKTRLLQDRVRGMPRFDCVINDYLPAGRRIAPDFVITFARTEKLPVGLGEEFFDRRREVVHARLSRCAQAATVRWLRAVSSISNGPR